VSQDGDGEDGPRLVVLNPSMVTIREPTKKQRRARTEYDPALAQEIAEVMAVTVSGMQTLCASRPHWPTAITVVRWEGRHEEFRELMGAARRARADMLIAEVVEIADDAANDLIQIGENTVPNPVGPARSKIRCDVRMKAAAMLHPQKYGAKLDVSGSVGHYVSQEDAIRQLR